jgi:hypothetical protein
MGPLPPFEPPTVGYQANITQHNNPRRSRSVEAIILLFWCVSPVVGWFSFFVFWFGFWPWIKINWLNM